MLSFRFCFYAIHTMPWVLVGCWLLNLLMDRGQPCGYTSPAEGVFIGLMVVFALMGLVLGGKMLRRQLVLLCPFCSRPGLGHLERSEGLTMECPKCGEIRGGGRLGWKIVRDKEEACGPKPKVPVGKFQFQFQSPWFWGLFGVSVVSAVCGVVIHEFSFFTVFPPLWCFLMASHLIETLRTGCLDDNEGPTFRSRQPVKYWARTFVWLCGYAFAVYMPVGYALQERGEMGEKAKTEVRAGGEEVRGHGGHLECGRGVRNERSYRFRRPDGGLRPENIHHPAKAVATMQACAVHLRDRTPNQSRST